MSSQTVIQRCYIIAMKKANWLKNQDAKPLAYVFPAGKDKVVGLPWRKAYSSMLTSLARIIQSGGYHEVPRIVQKAKVFVPGISLDSGILFL
jgi:hypothetical protein